MLVSVDSSPVHLAGALGVSTHIVLPRHGQHFVWGYPEWTGPLVEPVRMTPWYPSARIRRQTTRGDWSGPVSDIAEELAAMGSAKAQALVALDRKAADMP